ASTAWPSLALDDLILVPGWEARSLARADLLSSASLARLARHHAAGGALASVCPGAEALGRAGLLDGRRCTTHHDIQDELARRYPRATVVRDVLYVVDDRIATSPRRPPPAPPAAPPPPGVCGRPSWPGPPPRPPPPGPPPGPAPGPRRGRCPAE